MLDSLLWLIHKTSTFNIPIENEVDSGVDEVDERGERPFVTMKEVCAAVNEEFGASLLPGNMISSVLLLCLSHGILVDAAMHSDLQTVSRKCDS